ncbi:hypothetical protein D9M69_665820 [compost metagenome]
MNDEKTATITATIIMLLNLRVSRKAIAPGAMSSEMARIMPTAFRTPTIVSEMRHRSP